MMDFKLTMDNDKSKQWFKRTCIVCVVTCVFVFCCCIYCTLILSQMREFSSRCDAKQQSGATWGMSETGEREVLNQRDVYAYEAGPNVRNKRKALEDTKKAIQKVIDESTKGKANDSTNGTDKKSKESKKNRDKKKKKKKKKTRTKAAHYESVFQTPFKNSSFLPNEEELNRVIRSFKPATWVVDKNSPFSVTDNGFFTARFTGLYLIYAQVLFSDNKEAELLRLVQVRNDRLGGTVIQTLTCHDSVDKSGPLRYTSCGVTGLFNINKGDIVYMENHFSDVTLNLNESTTYFGAILLK